MTSQWLDGFMRGRPPILWAILILPLLLLRGMRGNEPDPRAAVTCAEIFSRTGFEPPGTSS